MFKNFTLKPLAPLPVFSPATFSLKKETYWCLNPEIHIANFFINYSFSVGFFIRKDLLQEPW